MKRKNMKRVENNQVGRKLLPAVVTALAVVLHAAAESVVIGDFTKADGGWGDAHHMKDVAASSAGTSFTVTDIDPWIIGPKVALPAAAPGATKVRFIITCEPTMNAGLWDVYYDFDGKGFKELDRFPVYPCTPAPCTQFIGDLPAEKFAGLTGRFRIDPPSVSGRRLTIKSFTAEIAKPLWSYRPATPSKLVLPENAETLEGNGWKLSHDPVRMGAFRYESCGKTVEGNPGEACVVLGAANKPYSIDWSAAKASVTRVKDGIVVTAKTVDAEGRAWRMTRSFAKMERGRALAITTWFACAQTKVLHIPYLTLFADRDSNGRKRQAMLAGLEYLDDEPSSNTKDIRMVETNRLIPSLHRITSPLAVITDKKAWLGAEWKMPKKQEYSVVFDTPDRQFKSGGHLLAFWFPAVGKARFESELDLYGAEPYSGGSQTVILRAGRGGNVADALVALVDQRKLPQRDAFDTADTLELLSHGWLDSKIRNGTKISHAVGFPLNQASDAPALMKWLAVQIERRPNADKALVKRLREMADAMFAAVPPKAIGKVCVSHIQRPASPLLSGDINGWFDARAARLRLRVKDLANGYRVWVKPGPGAKYDMGETLGASDCNGYTAMALEELLLDATWSGDEASIAKALGILDKAIARYDSTVPRGAQPWEMPLHTPDLVAAGLMIRCSTLGYLLNPNVKYLRTARYWAYTGLSMVYLIPPPFTFADDVKPFGCYATCGVMGSSNWRDANWMGRPVQWCGLVYSAALYDYLRFCGKKEADFWRTIADGIVASGVRQCHPLTDTDRQGLLPDSVNINSQSRIPPSINPGDVQENLSEMLKSPYYALRAFPGKKPTLLHMAGDAAELSRKGDELSCKVDAWPETESRMVLTRIGAVSSVTLNGRELAFTYDAGRRAAVVTLPARANGNIVIKTKTEN